MAGERWGWEEWGSHKTGLKVRGVWREFGMVFVYFCSFIFLS